MKFYSIDYLQMQSNINDYLKYIVIFSTLFIRYPIIVDGLANHDLLEILNKDSEWLETEVTKKGFSKISEVYLGEYLSGRINLYGYEK